jgi:hypothetical protein
VEDDGLSVGVLELGRAWVQEHVDEVEVRVPDLETPRMKGIVVWRERTGGDPLPEVDELELVLGREHVRRARLPTSSRQRDETTAGLPASPRAFRHRQPL